MAHNKKYTVAFKRKLSKKTDYRKRLDLIKSRKLRLVIRPHLNNMILQIVEFNPGGDHVLITITSKQLVSYGWNYHRGNMPSAYLTGLLLGKKAHEKKIYEAILDIGLNSGVKASRIYAVLKGAVDAGLKIPYSEEVLPKDEIVQGKAIVEYDSLLQKNKDIHDKQFSNYIKNKINIEDLPKVFNQVKNKILGKEK